jgi:hypothetical protein
MLDVKVVSWNGVNPLKIDKEGSVQVVVNAHPPLDEQIYPLPFREFFVDSNGSSDMAINGSVTNVAFSISASQDYDIYIKYVSVEIGDGGSPNLNLFGALPALTNGVEFCHFNNTDGFYTLHEGVKTNKAFIRMGTDTAAIGTGVDSFLADTSGGGSEKSYFPNIDFAESYGMPWGIRLRKGSEDKLIFKVKDNLSNLTTFNAVGSGIRLE